MPEESIEVPKVVEETPMNNNILTKEELPVWTTTEEKVDINKVVVPDNFNNNMFWTPVSDDKLEHNNFPNINNIGFPDIN